MNYKLSKYNLIVQENNKYLIYNSLKCSFSIIEKSLYKKLQSAEIIDELLSDSLYHQGIILDENIDESELAAQKYKSIVETNVLSLIIMPTMGCNFRCPYCYESHSNITMDEETEDAIIKFVEQSIDKYKYLRIGWFGGEPMLCLDTIEKINIKCLEIARSHNKIFHSSITTNGFYLNYDNFRRLRKARVSEFQITIDGDEDSHNKTRPLAGGGKTFKTIKNNLTEIHKKSKGRMFNIYLRINLNKENVLNFDKFMNEFNELFGDDKRISFCFRETGDWGGDSINSMRDKLINDKEEIIRCLTKYNKPINLSQQFTVFHNSPICYAGKHGNLVINPEGNVLKCTVDLDADNNIVGKLNKSGQIEYNSNLSLWINSGYNRDNECDNCSMYANCFNDICPKHIVNNGTNRCDNCSKIPMELKTLYKFNDELFKEII